MGSGGMVDGCYPFIKYSMFISNFVIFVAGLAAFGAGVWTVVDKSFINELLGTNLFLGVAYVVLATGGIVTLVAFFGCLGAIKEIKCMLLTYALFLLMTLVVMLVGGVLGYVFREKVRHSMEQEMYSSIKLYSESRAVRRAWDDTQENLECCGVTSFNDWKGYIPDSCCKELNGKKLNCKQFQTTLNTYTDGCLNKTEEFVKEHASFIGALAIIVSCLMVFGFMFAVAMFMMIGD